MVLKVYKNMFIGGFLHTLDKKGRIVLPARFREIIKEKYIDIFIMTKWFDNCISMFPMKEWKALEQKLNSMPKTDINARQVDRIIFSNATDAVVDKQGRVFIPNNLRTMVGIEKDVFILGHSDRIEIWSKKIWDEYNTSAKPLEEYAQELTKLGV